MMKKLASTLVLVLAAASGCGDDGGDSPADARVTIDAPVSTVDAPVNTADADTSTADADTTTADADTTTADASLADADTTDADTTDADTTDADTTSPDAMPTTGLVINEVVKTHTGANTMEFIEIKGAASTDYSAYWVLVVDSDDSPNAGHVDRAYQLGSTNAEGYWDTGFLDRQLENGAISFLLVKDFSGTGDPSTGTDLDTNNDGTIDVAPWTELVDDVGLADATGTNIFYGVEAGQYDGASRIPDGTDTDMAADWVENTGNPDNSGVVSGEAHNTRGAVNVVEP